MSNEKQCSKDKQQYLQMILNKSLSDWYPELTQSSYTCVKVQHRKLRWSEHFVYQIHAENEFHNKKILIKMLHEEDKKGRSQDVGVRSLQRVKLEYEALTSIYNSFKGMPIEGITAARPLAYYPDINALALEYLPGRHLLSVLSGAGALFGSIHGTQVVEGTAYSGGKLLAIVHKIQREGYPRQQDFSRDTYFIDLQKKVNALFQLDKTKRILKIITNMRHLLERKLARAGEKVTISHLHGDYYPENIVRLPDERVFTIDTTLHQVGPVEQDIAKFLIGTEITKRHLLFGSLGMNSTVPVRVNQAFLKGYQSNGKYNPRVLLAFQFSALLQRWIEVLEVMESRVPLGVGTLLKKTCITPSMLRSIDTLREKTEVEGQFYD